MKTFIKRALKIITSALSMQPTIGGLEVSDAFLRFVYFKKNKAKFISLKIPPGIIEDGKVKDVNSLVAMFQNLHSQVTMNKRKRIYVVANISDGATYVEMFTIPKTITQEELDEAAKLNLQMVSPLDFDSAYSDWQVIGEQMKDGMSQIELLGAFVPRKIIDDFEVALTRANFGVVAVEFPSLSLSRVLIELDKNIIKDKPYLVLHLGSDGISFNIVKGGNPSFVHFISWASIYGDNRKIAFQSFKQTIIDETQKVLSFYESKWGMPVNDAVLVSPALGDEIIRTMKENFPLLSMNFPSLPQFKTISPVWLPALGSAFRGMISRSKDTIITLASKDTEEEFMKYQLINFVKIWSNAAFTVLGGFLVGVAFVNVLFMEKTESLEARAESVAAQTESMEFLSLKRELESFNSTATLLLAASKQRILWAPFLKKMESIASSSVSIKRLWVPSLKDPVYFLGEAPDEETIIEFKKKLDSEFSEVVFSLSSVSPIEGGRFSFSLTFKAKGI